MKGIKRITITTEDGEEFFFEPTFPVTITQQRGYREKATGDFFILENEPNGIKTLLIFSAPDPIRNEVVAAAYEIITKMING